MTLIGTLMAKMDRDAPHSRNFGHLETKSEIRCVYQTGDEQHALKPAVVGK